MICSECGLEGAHSYVVEGARGKPIHAKCYLVWLKRYVRNLAAVKQAHQNALRRRRCSVSSRR